MKYLIAFLILEIIIMSFSAAQKNFKIGYYEAKLEHRNVNISEVKNMPFYKMWIKQ